MGIDAIHFHQPLGLFLSVVLFVSAGGVFFRARKREGEKPLLYLLGIKRDNSPFMTNSERFWFALSFSGAVISGSLAIVKIIDIEHITTRALLFFILFFLVFLANPSKKNTDQN